MTLTFLRVNLILSAFLAGVTGFLATVNEVVFSLYANIPDAAKIAVAVYVENGGWGADYGVPLGGLIMEQYLKGELSETSKARADEFQKRRINYGTDRR